MHFTASPPVLMAPCAPIDPVRGRFNADANDTTLKGDRKITLSRLKNQQKEASKVDPLSFHALTFNQTDWLP